MLSMIPALEEKITRFPPKTYVESGTTFQWMWTEAAGPTMEIFMLLLLIRQT